MNFAKSMVVLATVLLPILVCLSVLAENALWFAISLTLIPIWTAVMIQLEWEDI